MKISLMSLSEYLHIKYDTEYDVQRKRFSHTASPHYHVSFCVAGTVCAA